MAITISFDLTDEQWEVIKVNYPRHMIDSNGEVLTPELLSNHLFRDIKMYVRAEVRNMRRDLSILDVFDE